jgi:hypothetical protein
MFPVIGLVQVVVPTVVKYSTVSPGLSTDVPAGNLI